MNTLKSRKIYYAVIGSEEPYLLVFDSAELRNYILENLEDNYFDTGAMSIGFDSECLVNCHNIYSIMPFILSTYGRNELLKYINNYLQNQEIPKAELTTININEKEELVGMIGEYLLTFPSEHIDPLRIQLLVDQFNNDIKIQKSLAYIETQPIERVPLF